MLKKQNRQLRIKLFEAVRDIPYYLGDNKTNASCGAKAKLLGEILGKIGLKCRLIYCYFNWDDTKIPKEITRKAPHKQARHILLKVYIPERKKWVFVDPTWDNKLATYFKISKWNGVSNTTITVPTKRFFYLKDQKGKLISCQKFQVRNFNPKEPYTKSLNNWFKKIENKTYSKAKSHERKKYTHIPRGRRIRERFKAARRIFRSKA